MQLAKVFGVFRRARKGDSDDAPPEHYVVDLRVDAAVFEKLKERASKDGMSLDAAALASIERGMKNCSLYSMWEYKRDFELIKELTVQYKHDNELLKALLKQNDALSDLLYRDTLKQERGGDAK